jgi:hypothetical protein
VALLDTDDGALLVHPEPPGFKGFLARVAAARVDLGGDPCMGRKLAVSLRAAGLADVRAELVSLTSEDHPFATLVEQAFGSREDLLRRAGLWRVEDAGGAARAGDRARRLVGGRAGAGLGDGAGAEPDLLSCGWVQGPGTLGRC